MKAIIPFKIFFFAVLIGLTGCGSGSDSNTPPANTTPFIAAPGQSDSNLQFSQLEYNFGVVKQGTVVEYKFEYKNVAAVPVSITQVHVSCPCMSTEHTAAPIQPGERGFIKCTFDTKEQRAARYEKIFAVQVSNQQKIPSLYMKGSIVE